MTDYRVQDVLRCRATEIPGADNVLQAVSVASGVSVDELEMADGVCELAQWRVSCANAGMVFSVRRRWS